ncbi:MAG: diacylglycerol kinase family protein [Burkholderiales bacterium]
MSRYLVILNPAAGRGRVRREWPRMAEALRAAGVGFDLAHTDAPGAGIGWKSKSCPVRCASCPELAHGRRAA